MKRIREEFELKHKERKDDPSAFSSTKGISVYAPTNIGRTKKFEVVQKAEQKLYSFFFDKRIILSNYDTIPFGFVTGN